MDLRIGNGLDVHPFASDGDRVLVLCGVEVAEGPGLDGHSDADVATHAVADALLGALAMGDLGSWFGVDEPEVAGADSLRLLAAVVAGVADRGWAPANVDLTVVAQGPRLSPYREAMRDRLARVLHLDLDAVSVKFTTTDRLGFLGRGEGIAAWATVTVLRRSGAATQH
ncbi:2-C-methyl-D-erythritol 2,4-cyclodiphosphate synthase [Egicoccus sp. AB-alg6-2]|uniref:2-C-methyl-D-erythritol 2,4-cyclodiphosphate synthase n=1 Tax=Egicoccus sp. AB-alg6-2 TaxID=3242692 RepID=UPI00359E88F7